MSLSLQRDVGGVECTSNAATVRVKDDVWSKENVGRASRGAIKDDFSVLGVAGRDITADACPGETFEDLLSVATVRSAALLGADLG